MKSPVDLNSLLLIFFYVTWFDETRHWRPCKRRLLSIPFVSSKQWLSGLKTVNCPYVISMKIRQKKTVTSTCGEERQDPSWVG